MGHSAEVTDARSHPCHLSLVPKGCHPLPVLLCLLRTWLCFAGWKQREAVGGEDSLCAALSLFTASVMCCFLATCFLVWCLLCLLQAYQIEKGDKSPDYAAAVTENPPWGVCGCIVRLCTDNSSEGIEL